MLSLNRSCRNGKDPVQGAGPAGGEIVDELVFCCTKCLGLSYLGLSMERQGLQRCQHRPVRTICRHCGETLYGSLSNMMVSSGLDERGRFVPIGEMAEADDPMTSRSVGWLASELRPPR